MTPAEESQRLRDITARFEAASTDWRRVNDNGDDILQARLIPAHDPTPVATFDRHCDRNDMEFLAWAHSDTEFLLRLINRAIARYRRENPPRPKPTDHAQICAIHCGKPAFQRWLHEVHNLDHPSDPQRAATKIHGLLAIKSRKELNENPEAAARWTALKADFEKWMKT